MKAVTKIDSKTVVLNISDIDTDQIIPARFLTTTTLDGLGKYLFYDWRYNSDGTANPEFILNDDKISNCHILVAGDNFGCGSSREHAPWALKDFGFQAIISSRIADIFRSNALKNGLIPIEVNDEILNKLLANPGINLSIDIKTSMLYLPDKQSVKFEIDQFSHHCLLEGTDELGFIQSHIEIIKNYEENRSWKP
jgi:3-isopropylmalate/(R)-2-methylmalate dehydratase small subunit